MDVYVYSCINKSVKNFEKVNQSNIFLYHVIEKLIFLQIHNILENPQIFFHRFVGLEYTEPSSPVIYKNAP